MRSFFERQIDFEPRGGSELDRVKTEHGGRVMEDRILLLAPMLLISKPDGIVANDRVADFVKLQIFMLKKLAQCAICRL